jgi:uncharacterized glyoxalase superfamily protein PhnB
MMMRHGQHPDTGKIPLELKEAVLHARINIGDTVLMGADIPGAQPMRSAYLSLSPTAQTRPSASTLSCLTEVRSSCQWRRPSLLSALRCSGINSARHG